MDGDVIDRELSGIEVDGTYRSGEKLYSGWKEIPEGMMHERWRNPAPRKIGKGREHGGIGIGIDQADGRSGFAQGPAGLAPGKSATEDDHVRLHSLVSYYSTRQMQNRRRNGGSTLRILARGRCRGCG